jgi:hypothetical protein
MRKSEYKAGTFLVDGSGHVLSMTDILEVMATEY